MHNEIRQRNNMIKPVFRYKIGHRNSPLTIHFAFSCKTSNRTSDPAPGCPSLVTEQWSRLVIRSNVNDYTHRGGSHSKHKYCCIHSDKKVHNRLGILTKIPWLWEYFIDINHAGFVCLQIRNSIVTSCSIKLNAVLLIICHFVMKSTTSLWPLKAKRHGSCQWMYRKNNVIPVIPVECAHKLGLMVLFRYG